MPSRLQLLIASLEPLSPAEVNRRRQGAQRLKVELSPIPWYEEQVAKDGEVFWMKLYASQLNS